MSGSLLAFDQPLGRLVRWPLRFVPREARVSVLTGPLKGARWIVGSSTHGCWLGTYERRLQARFSQEAKRADVVYDIGAHVGLYTLLAARSVRKGGRVIAFEPLPRNVRYLIEHVRLNRLSHVTVEAAAVSDVTGSVSFNAAESSSMGQIGDHGELRVPAIRLDDLTRKLPDPDLIKIDVEGAELRVLAGATDLIRRARPTVMLATHSSELHQACRDWLDAAGYRIETLAADEIVATPRDPIGR